MNKLFYILSIFLFLAACKNNEPTPDVAEETIVPVKIENEMISFSKNQMHNIEMKVEQIQLKSISSEKVVNGHIEIPQKNKATVSSMYEGIVSKIYVEEGTPIAKGQTIAVITNAAYLAEQEEYLLTNSQIAMAQTEVNRQSELYKGDAGPLKNLQRAQSELKSLQIKKSALAQRLRMQGINPNKISASRMVNTFSIVSPISGMLTHIFIQNGSTIGMQTPVAEVINKNDMHAVLDVFEKDQSAVYEGQQVEFTTVANPKVVHRAHVISVSPKVSETTRALEVHCHINGAMEDLIEGSAIVAKLNGGAQEGLVIPEEAIVEYEGRSIIFKLVKAEGDKLFFNMQPVTVINKRENECLIKAEEGLSAETKIITRGAFMTLGSITNLGEDE